MKTHRNFILYGGIALSCITALILWPRQQSVSHASQMPLHRSGESGNQLSQNSTPVRRPLSEPAGEPSPVAALDREPITSKAGTTEEPELAKLDAFDDWISRWSGAGSSGRKAIGEEGVRLAAARRPEFKALIASNPQLALERAVPRAVRQELPEAIVSHLETPVSAEGEFRVTFICGCPSDRSVPEHGKEFHPSTERLFVVGGTSYNAHVYGNLERLSSRRKAPLQGVAVDHEMAVAPNAVRPLEPGERVPAGAAIQALDVERASARKDAPSRSGEIVAEVAGQWTSVESQEELAALQEDFNQWVLHEYDGSNSTGFFYENFPNPTAKRVGNYKLLYIPVRFEDLNSTGYTEESVVGNVREMERIYGEWSYGKMVCTSTITPVVTMPFSWASIQDDVNRANWDVSVHAMDTVRRLGYDPGGYDTVVVHAENFGGVSFGGNNFVVIGGGLPTLLHEVGHQLGAWHSGLWAATDGTGYGYRENGGDTYGNPFDIMGNYGIPDDRAHFNVMSKILLGWLAPQDIHQVRDSGVYRIHAFDQPLLEQGRRYGLVAEKERSLNYYFEYRPSLGGRLDDSALVLLGDGVGEARLVDTTPHTPATSNLSKRDSGIAVGRTFSDLEADMHFTVVSKNATTPPSLDIAYHRGPFPGNRAPELAAIIPSSTSIGTGGSITFDASGASDPDGDTLAYHWDFGDGAGSPNSAVVTRTFTSAAQVTAQVTVSDMKGGTVRRHVVVDIGNHGKQSVTGTVTVGGQPLENVYVKAPDGQYAFTDESGNYALSNLSTGSTTLTASLNGYTLTPSFTNPLDVVDGSNVADWTASESSTFVTLSKVEDATEGGQNGIFRLTRTGDTAADLEVRVVEPGGGTAVIGDDFTLSPDRTVGDDQYDWRFTIPAGQASLDIEVDAVDDAVLEGPETIRLHLSLNGSYLLNEASAAVMTIHDNDTGLPQVAVISDDPFASELPTDPGSFTFTRTGPTQASLDLSVAWSGTATNGVDFAELPSVVTIPSGEASLTIDVLPLDDNETENIEVVTGTIQSSPLTYVVESSRDSASVELTDDDLPVISISVPGASASESGPDTGLLLVHRSGSTDAALKVYYGVGGSALHGRDYASLSGEVVIPAGASSAPIVISPIDDENSEGAETVEISLAPVTSGYGLGASHKGTVTISDNEQVPVVSVRPGVTGVEGGADASVIFRSSGGGSGNVTVNYAVGGTATAGEDFEPLIGSVVLPAGGSNDTVLTIPVIDDGESEPTESVTITLVPDDGYLIENGSSADALIRDNDSGGDRVNATVLRGSAPSESGPTTGSFHVSRTSTAGDLVVNYALSGTAANGDDYANLPGTVTIPDGQRGVNVDIVPVDDALAEGIETVTLTVLPGTGYSPEALGENTLEILDNEGVSTTLGFVSGSSSAAEPLDGEQGFHNIEVRLSEAPPSPVTVQVVAGSGTTARGDNVDWAFVDAANNNELLPAAVLEFAPGTTSRMARIRVHDDGLSEPVEEITLQLHSPRGASLSSTEDEHKVYIIDGGVVASPLVTEERWNTGDVYTNGTWDGVAPDYSGVLMGSFTPAQNVGEDFSRRLKGVVTAPATGSYTFWIASDDASRLFISTDATAANKVERAGLSGATTFQNWTANASQQSAPLDLVAGQSYYVEVQHQEIGGGDHVSLAWEGPGFTREELIPTMPDSSVRTLRFAMETSTRTEADGGEPRLMVALDRPAGAAGVSVDLVIDGSATSGSDYSLSPGTLVFAPGEIVKHLPLVIHSDGVAEEPEWLRVSMENPVDARIGAPSSHTITILDSAAPVVETLFAQADPWMAAGTDLGGLVATTAPSVDIANWTILSGNTGNAFEISPEGRVLLQAPAALPDPGTMQLVVRATDTAGSFGDGVVNVVCNAMHNGVLEERWDGTSVYDSKSWNNPQYTGGLASLTTEQDIGDDYSRRLVSYLKPTVSGDYHFYIAGDDDCRLLLSTDETALNLTPIASVDGWTSFQAWNTQPGQRSGAVALEAGEYYRIEVEHMEMAGGDHVSVAWEGPGIALQPIPSSVLYTPNGVTEQRWEGTLAFDVNDWSGLPSFAASVPTFTSNQNVGDSYSRRLTGYLKPPVGGDYTFWIAGDDDCRLYLSSDASPSNKSQIAAVAGWTPYQSWDSDRTSVNQVQKSVTIPLESGRRYWMEVHHKEGAGDDHVSVAWSGPGISRQPIPASAILPALDGVDFEPPPQAPFIAMTAPADGSQVDTGESVSLSAMVTGGTVATTSVEFYQGGAFVGSDSTAPYSVSWTASSTGSHSLTARAVYPNGSVSSAPVMLDVVDPDPTADPDGDGFNTGLEQTLGTDPYDSASQPDSSYAGLIGWWKLDEGAGTLAHDATGRPQDGTVGGASWISGIDQGALAFDGVDDQVEISPSLLSGRSSFTLSGWFRTSTSARGTSLGLFGQNDVIELGIKNDQVRVWTAGGGGIVSAPMPALGEWHHVACVGDGTTVKLYLDGSLAATGGSATTNYGNSAYPFRIGGGVWDSSGGYFHGDTDDVRVYQRALSATEICGMHEDYTLNQSSQLTSNSETQPNQDTDGDGLADSWEALYYSPAQYGPNDDPDGDGQSNADEYVAGTCPTNGADTIRLRVVSASPAVFEFDGKAGRTYTLERAVALGSGDWQQIQTVGPLANDGTTQVTDPAPSAVRGFYRLQIELIASP